MDSYSFGDVRVDERGSWMFEQIVATGSLLLRRIGGDRAGEIAAGRFLASPGVTAEAIIATHAERTRRAAEGRRVVAVQDTTEINFSGRDRGRTRLGRAASSRPSCSRASRRSRT
jgi:hypothetical protein